MNAPFTAHQKLIAYAKIIMILTATASGEVIYLVIHPERPFAYFVATILALSMFISFFIAYASWEILTEALSNSAALGTSKRAKQ